MRFLWDLMEKSETSFAAQCVSFISLSFILVSTVGMCLNTIPAIAEKDDNGKHFISFNIIMQKRVLLFIPQEPLPM